MVPTQAKWALPICVQKPFAALWRAPVSSTVIQAALASPARSTSRLGKEAVLAGDQQTHELSIGDENADRQQQSQQSRHRDLPLMVLEKHEAAQFRPKMSVDAGRQRRRQNFAVRLLPAALARSQMPAAASDRSPCPSRWV